MIRNRICLDGTVSEVEAHATSKAGEYSVRIGGNQHRVRVLPDVSGRRVALVDDRVLRLATCVGRSGVQVLRSGNPREVDLEVSSAGSTRLRRPSAGTGELNAPMPGRVLAVQVTLGQAVELGAPLVLIEAMKMQNQLFSSRAGVVSSVLVKPGMVVERGALLVRIE